MLQVAGGNSDPGSGNAFVVSNICSPGTVVSTVTRAITLSEQQ